MKTNTNASVWQSIFKSMPMWVMLPFISNIAQAQINVNVDMNATIATAKAEHYGLNFQNAFDPAIASNSAYKARVDELQPKIVRYHAAEQIINGHASSWIDYATQTWNATKINQVLSQKPASATDILITISGWPTWMDTDGNGKLDDDKKDTYANFCADLVQIVNNQLGYNVKYWEPFNEMDGGNYIGSSDMWHLADIHKKCFTAMKAKSAAIKIVGGAWRQHWDNDINDFLYNLGGGYLDVWSHHNYGGGDDTDITNLYTKTRFDYGITNIRTKLNEKGYSAVPIWLGEFNIYWAWNNVGFENMTNHVGATFDALSYKYLIAKLL